MDARIRIEVNVLVELVATDELCGVEWVKRVADAISVDRVGYTCNIMYLRGDQRARVPPEERARHWGVFCGVMDVQQLANVALSLALEQGPVKVCTVRTMHPHCPRTGLQRVDGEWISRPWP